MRFGLEELKREYVEGEIGVVTNATGVTSELENNITFLKRKGFAIKKIFVPEHGYYGTYLNGEPVPNTQIYGIPIYSLYGSKMSFTKDDLEDIATLIYDIQDAGVRYYTYLSVLLESIKSAKKYNVGLIVLDRPNIINGTKVDGPLLKQGFESYIGPDQIPIRYGMTIGELALFFNRKFNANLQVVKMFDYKRDKYFDDIFNWYIPPSLHLPSVNAIINYSALGLFEATNISVGRGTPYPFLQFGAPFLKDLTIRIPGAVLRQTMFTPCYSLYKDQLTPGYFIHIIDRENYNPYYIVVKILHDFWNDKRLVVDYKKLDMLYGSSDLRKYLDQGLKPEEIMETWKEDLEKFREVRKKYLLY